jgi:hypothetical protein
VRIPSDNWHKLIDVSAMLQSYIDLFSVWRDVTTDVRTITLPLPKWNWSKWWHSTNSLLLTNDPGTHWIGGWVGPRAVLGAVVKRKIPSPRRESNPRTPIVQPVVQLYTDLDTSFN